MKKKVFLLVGVAAMMAFQACQESTTLNGIEKDTNDSSSEIRFTNYVSGLTRASRAKGDSFRNGDRMQVYGFQTLNDTTSLLFNKQLVTNYDGWYYNPPKYWEKNSTYDFYAIFPYNLSENSFDLDERLFTVSNFAVQDNADDQIDLMIAKRITDHQPYNLVQLEFSHILSNVNFYLKTDDEFNIDGIKGVKVINFDITGLYSDGTFAQSGWDNNNVFTGQWTPVETSVYDMPEVKDSVYLIGSPKAQTIVDDLLLLPQQINDNAMVTITFTILYEDGTESAFTRSTALNKIVGAKKSVPSQSVELAKWEPNFRYNYTISVNPSITQHGGHFLPNANDEHSWNQFENEDIEANIIIAKIDTDGDEIPDEYWIDSNGDDIFDYPIIWKDIDGDGKYEEALPDRDQDGQPDYTNGSDEPDMVWIDKYPEGNPDGIVDTPLQREKTTPQTTDPDLPDNPDDPNYPDTAYVDYDGGAGDGYKNPVAWFVTDDEGEFWVDTDGDGHGDIKVVWKDVDGDGMLEGIADKDGDGQATEADNYDGDGKDYLGNDNDYDVILYAHVVKNDDGTEDYEKDDEGNIIWHELEKPVPSDPDIPEPESTAIQFSATVTEWNDEYNAEYVIKE